MVILNFNEFHEFMMANGFKYSVGIVLYLDMISMIAKRIRRYQQCTDVESDAWITERQQEQQTLQQMAIELAYTEKDNGPMLESRIHALSGRQRRSVNQSVKRMAPYLKRLGIEIEVE